MALGHPLEKPGIQSRSDRSRASHLPLNFLFLYNAVTCLYIKNDIKMMLWSGWLMDDLVFVYQAVSVRKEFKVSSSIIL